MCYILFFYRRANPRNKPTRPSVVSNSARFFATTTSSTTTERRPTLDPVVQAMPPSLSIVSQHRMLFTQPTPSSISPRPAHSFHYQQQRTVVSSNFGARPIYPRPFSCNQPVASTGMINPYAKRDDMAPPQHLSPRPTSVSTPHHQYQPALTPTRRSPFGNFGATGCQAPSATRPVPLPFPHGGMMFSDRLDSPASDYSWGNPAPPVTFEPLPDIRIKRSESSSSSSSGSSTLIDLQAQWNSDPLNAGKTTAAASLLSFGLLSDPSTASTPRRHGHGDALVVVAPPGPRSDASLPKAPPQQVPPPVPPLPAGAVKFSTAELARFVLNSDNLYGTKDITATTRQIAGVSTKHTAKCDSLLKMIFTLLANHPSPEMQYLAQDVEGRHRFDDEELLATP